MLALRNAALGMMWSETYALNSELPGRNGFSSVPKGKWKCNAFVADMAISVGLPVPVQRRTGLSWLWENLYQPMANDWASPGVAIDGWAHRGVGAYPVPGFVVAHPNPSGLGHCGIVDYDGEGIGAGTFRVTTDYDGFLDGTCGYREYIGGNNEDE